MKDYYLRTMTVQIPLEDGPVVIRQGKTVEYQLERTYESEDKSTRVKRRVIGKVDPVNSARMFPNETYFQLFPENEVPEEVRDEFLRECAIKRQMSAIRKNPEEIIEGVVNGLNELGAFRSPPSPFGHEVVLGDEKRMNYTMLRRLFDDVYYSVEELAGKYPNEVMDPYKAKRINEVLERLQQNVDEGILPYLRLIEEPEETGEDGKTILKGLTYSDILLMLKWYKVLPR